MIATTLRELVIAEPVLQRLMTLPRSAKASYHLARLARLIRPECEHFRAERDKLVKEMGEERDTLPHEQAAFGTRIHAVTAGNMEAFNVRVADLGRVCVELHWAPIPLATFETEQPTAADLDALMPLIADDAPTDTP